MDELQFELKIPSVDGFQDKNPDGNPDMTDKNVLGLAAIVLRGLFK